jgi:hypothetical protein
VTPEESTEILKLATAVGAIGARIDAIEAARTLARQEDHEWRDGLAGDIGVMKACMTEMPCMMDEKIRACREDRVEATAEAVSTVHDLKAFGIVAAKIATLAGVIAGAVFGVGKLFGWY